MKEQNEKFLPYKIVSEGGEGEIVEKKSRFIAQLQPAESEAEAMAFIDSVRKKYYDARHHCPAYIIGKNRELTRCSDDGEPGGTAGKPILEVLLAEGVTNAVLVVTRYFGGTLLGTGGLVRAYTQAAREAVKNCRTAVVCYCVLLKVTAAYTDLGKLQYLLEQKEIRDVEISYTDRVLLKIRIPEEEAEGLKKELTECTGARADIEEAEKGYYRLRNSSAME